MLVPRTWTIAGDENSDYFDSMVTGLASTGCRHADSQGNRGMAASDVANKFMECGTQLWR
jgi:hypothetical protein